MMLVKEADLDAWSQADEAVSRHVHWLSDIGLLSIVGRIRPLQWRVWLSRYQEESLIRIKQNNPEAFKIGPFDITFGNYKPGEMDDGKGFYVDLNYRLVGE